MAKGNIKVEMEWRAAQLIRLTLLSPISQEVTVNAAGMEMQVKLEANQAYQVIPLSGQHQKEG